MTDYNMTAETTPATKMKDLALYLMTSLAIAVSVTGLGTVLMAL